jgi:hypothetical protein
VAPFPRQWLEPGESRGWLVWICAPPLWGLGWGRISHTKISTVPAKNVEAGHQNLLTPTLVGVMKKRRSYKLEKKDIEQDKTGIARKGRTQESKFTQEIGSDWLLLDCEQCRDLFTGLCLLATCCTVSSRFQCFHWNKNIRGCWLLMLSIT